jgi:hypothetical protein
LGFEQNEGNGTRSDGGRQDDGQTIEQKVLADGTPRGVYPFDYDEIDGGVPPTSSIK